jgi:quercetin dioxygenase-like cupin family protein
LPTPLHRSYTAAEATFTETSIVPLRSSPLARLAATGALLIGVGVGALVDHVAFAQQPGGIRRTVLQRVDDLGNPGYEAVMAIAEIPAGATSGKHFHPGVEVAYVLDGSVVIERAKGAATTISKGQSLKNDSGGVHNAINKGTKPVKILAVYLVEKGKPLAETVP